jgi:hypothetical protein
LFFNFPGGKLGWVKKAGSSSRRRGL